MEFAKVRVTGVDAEVLWCEDIPRGIVGATVSIEYASPIWDELSKTVVFCGSKTKDVLNPGEEVEIPPETVEKSGRRLLMGIYGVDAAGKKVIPTFWAELGTVRSSADPSGDPSSDPSLPIWAQLQEQIKDLEKNGFSVDDEKLEEIVQKYLKENPPTQFEADEGTLSLEEGVLSVKTTNEVTEDDPTPITSGAVYNEFSKAVALLKTI